MPDIRKTIAKNLLFYRNKNKLSQKTLGEMIGVKHNTISSWESCTNAIDIDSICKIVDALNISINDILDLPTIEPKYNELFLIYNQLNEIGKKQAEEMIRLLLLDDRYVQTHTSKPKVHHTTLDLEDDITRYAAYGGDIGDDDDETYHT